MLPRFELHDSFLVFVLQVAAPRPQSRVTFGGTQMRNCSLSSESSRSSTSGSCCSRQCSALNTGKSFEARQTRCSSLSEAEDFQVTCLAQSQSNKPTSDLDRDMLGRRSKKAKIVQETSVRHESPSVQSASKPSQSFASLDQSLPETDADEYHFWSKISSPHNEDSFVGLDVDYDVESPLRWTGEDESGSLMLPSFSKTYDEPTRWSSDWQTSSNHARSSRGLGPNEDYFQRPGDVQQHKNVNSFDPGSTASGHAVNKECISASSSQSAVPHEKLATETLAVNSDARDQARVTGGDGAARSNKWWAFVHGITSDLSTPGCSLFCTDHMPF